MFIINFIWSFTWQSVCIREKKRIERSHLEQLWRALVVLFTATSAVLAGIRALLFKSMRHTMTPGLWPQALFIELRHSGKFTWQKRWSIEVNCHLWVAASRHDLLNERVYYWSIYNRSTLNSIQHPKTEISEEHVRRDRKPSPKAGNPVKRPRVCLPQVVKDQTILSWFTTMSLGSKILYSWNDHLICNCESDRSMNYLRAAGQFSHWLTETTGKSILE